MKRLAIIAMVVWACALLRAPSAYALGGGGGGSSSTVILPPALSSYTGAIGITGSQGNGNDIIGGAKLDAGWPISAFGASSSTEVRTLTTTASSPTATVDAIGAVQTEFNKGATHYYCWGCGPATTLTTPNAPTVDAGAYVDATIPGMPFQVAVTNCVQSIRVTQMIAMAEPYVKSPSANGMGLYSESDAAGTCTLTFNTSDAARLVRIYYAQSTPTAGTNNYYVYQQDFDANNGSTAVSAVASLTSVADMMVTQSAPLTIILDNATNASRHKSLIWVAECKDIYPGWRYNLISCIKPSVGNANGSFFMPTVAGLSSSTTVTTASPETLTPSPAFDGTTTQFSATLAHTGSIMPNSLQLALLPLPNWQATHSYALNAVISPQGFSTNPQGRTYKVTACSGGCPQNSGGTSPNFNQAAGGTTTDNLVTWTDSGTTGYGGIDMGVIHDDGSGNMIGKQGYNKVLTDPGTGTNTFVYDGASSGTLNIDFATAPQAGVTLQASYLYNATTPDFSTCQTLAQTCTVFGITWKNMGTTVPAAAFFKAGFSLGAQSAYDYWGSPVYSCLECATDGSPPGSATNGGYFFKVTAISGTTLTVAGENGSDATPDSSGSFTIRHDSTVPIANEIAQMTDNANVHQNMVVPPGTWNVAGQVLQGNVNMTVQGNGGLLLFEGDGVGACASNSTGLGLWEMRGANLTITGYLGLFTNNGSADAMICHPIAFGYLKVDANIFITNQSIGNRATAVSMPGSGSLDWVGATVGWGRVMFLQSANAINVHGGSVGGNPPWPELALVPCIAYGTGNVNDRLGAWLTMESCQNAIGPVDAQLNYFASGVTIDQIYDADLVGGLTANAILTGSGGTSPTVERAWVYNIRGSVKLTGGLNGGSGDWRRMGAVWIKGNLANTDSVIQGFQALTGMAGVLCDTKCTVTDTAFPQILSYGTGIEARVAGEFRKNLIQDGLHNTVFNPITMYKLGYQQDEATCNGNANLASGNSAFTLALQEDLLNTPGGSALTSWINGGPLFDICSGTQANTDLYSTTHQRVPLSIDTAGQVSPNILTTNPMFTVSNTTTGGVKLLNPGCGGSSASPSYRLCNTTDIGRTFQLQIACTVASPCGAVTFDTQYKTDSTCAVASIAINKRITGRFMMVGATEWDQVGPCSAAL